MPIPVFHLQALLSLRQSAEEVQKIALARATAKRIESEAYQQELENQVQIATVNLAKARERQRSGSMPSLVRDGLADIHFQEYLLNRLDSVTQAARNYRQGPLASAITGEEKARLAYKEAQKELLAIEKVAERDRMLVKKRLQLREEEAVDDMNQSAGFRNKAT